jgi:phosphoglycolate phosphatase-like HAD superfamily hydrolase
MSALAAVIFDFDGVLVESNTIKADAFEALYAEHGPDVARAVRAYHERHRGLSRFDKFRHYETQLLGRPEPDAAQLAELGRRFGECVEAAVVAAPMVGGAQALLDRLRGRVPMFVVSATPQDELLRIVAGRGLGGYFRDVRGTPGTKAALIAEIVARYALPAARTLMIGDAPADYEGARANGTAFAGRVPPGESNPFPAGVATVGDLWPLATRGPEGWLASAATKAA